MPGFRKEGGVLVWQMNHETVRIEPWGKDSLRVRSTVGREILDRPGALLEPERSKVQIKIHKGGAHLRNGKIKAGMSQDGCIRFLKAGNGELLLEEVPYARLKPGARSFKSISSDLYRIETRFEARDGERFYGLGQHRHGRLNQKGCVIDLAQRNCEVSIPFLLSSRGYGFLWNNPAVGRVELGANGTRWVAEAACQIDYWITAGDTYADIMNRYADAVGYAPMLPGWAAGFWQSKLRYRTQDELLSVAREYKRRGLPLSIIVIDFFHWKALGDWRFDREYWPDPAAMVRELDEMGVKVMVSVWPTVHPDSVNYEEAGRSGYLVSNERGIPAHSPFSSVSSLAMRYYDPTNPAARKFIWEKVREGYYRYGIKIFWLDACEPEIYPADPDNLRYHTGNGLEVANIYPLMHQKAFYDGMRSEGEEEVITLCRSAWAGSQRYGAAVWSGDIESTFEVLEGQVRAGLNIGLSGIPWWTTDIGGFLHGDITTPYFRELVVRWFQYGCWCPLFRLHGERRPYREEDQSAGPNEVWSFGEDAYEIIKESLFLRERLRPYIMKQMRLAHRKGIPPMRPLFFDFPGDEGCADIEDQFLFGPDVLVAPVVKQGARSREVYLPAGTNWTDAWTDKKLKGGQRIEAVAPIERIPVYLRGDSELPIRSR